VSEDLPQPPEQIRQSAHVAGNGELLWPRAAAIEVARWIGVSELAIWGGEVYSPRGPFTAVMVHEWRTDPGRGVDEPWLSYVERGLAQALEAIEKYPSSDPVSRTAESTAQSLYFLAYHTQAGFPGEPRPSRTVEGRYD
jgi:hypothetical protein